MKDRRESPRYEVVLKVRYETERAFRNIIVQNVSSGGFYITTETPFEVGYQFQIEVELPGKKEWIKGTCKVVWVNEIDTQSYPKGMGVTIVEMSPKYRKRIEKYLYDMNGPRR